MASYSLSDPAQCAAVLREALATPGPALIEATVDPNEPPMPPKATFEQTKNLVEALAELLARMYHHDDSYLDMRENMMFAVLCGKPRRGQRGFLLGV